MARILVVEDDLDTANLLNIRLRSYGHAVVTAPSGNLAIHMVGLDFPIELVLLDIDLHGMDGFDVLEQLRRHPELENPTLPAIFLSGSSNPEHRRRANELGASFLAKPFVSGELQVAILQTLNIVTPS